MHLTDFQIIRPPFEMEQEETLRWLTKAHAYAEAEGFEESFAQTLRHVGCKPEHIEKRGYVLSDFSHRDWEKMRVYSLSEHPEGRNLTERAKVFEEEADKIFEAYYPDGSTAPDDLIHVSCTGYVSPSGAQKIVSKRNWGCDTTVTHAYHMGCYGSMPAARIGIGFLNASPHKERVDVVHTEICCLHVNPTLHRLDQLVSQSLFADGFIKYSYVRSSSTPSFKMLNIREEIIPDSSGAMTWNVVDWGFQMSLSKEVPVFITRHLHLFLQRLGVDVHDVLFAVHPGGPKILAYVQKTLGLKDDQMRFSHEILKNYGNMSSATLPHIWQKILEDESVLQGTKVVSLAFGPGLTIAGSLMEKSCGF